MSLTIIIPHYNSYDSLQVLLKSIPSQYAIQIIVVDDRSDPEQLNKLKQSQSELGYELYINNGVKGAGSCRNIGLLKAKNDWLLFADADDFFCGDFYTAIEPYFRSAIELVYFIPTSVYSGTQELAGRHIKTAQRLQSYLNKPTKNNELIVKYKIVTPWSKLFKKSLILDNHIRFDEIIASNDVFFSIKAAHHAESFAVSPNVIYTVTKGRHTLTASRARQVLDVRLDVYIRLNLYLKSFLDARQLSTLGYDKLTFVLNVLLNHGLTAAVYAFGKLWAADINFFYLKQLRPELVINNIKTLLENNKFNKVRDK